MTITCPRCGLAFETRATTNTRCRRCKSVVRVGSGPAIRSTRREDPEELSNETPGGAGLLVVAGLIIVAFYVVPIIVRAVRDHRSDRARPVDPVGLDVSPAPTFTTGDRDANGA